MKTLLLVFAAAGLTGCAVYPAPAYDTYGGVAPSPYVVQPPVYVQGGAVYRSGGYPGGYYAPPPPIIFPHHPHRPLFQGPRRGWGDRDRDGIPNRLDRDRDNDGVRNRMDRDRDGDGVRNRHDRRPNNPNRR